MLFTPKQKNTAVMYDTVQEHHEWDNSIPPDSDIFKRRPKQLKLFHEKFPQVRGKSIML